MRIISFLIKRKILLHIILWAIFIVYEVAVAYTLGGRLSSFVDYAGHYVLNISLFYFNALIVFNKYLSRKNRSFFVLFVLVVLEMAIYTVIKYFLYQLFVATKVYTPAEAVINYYFFMETSWRAIYFLGLSAGYWFVVFIFKQRGTISDLEKVRLKNILEREELEKNLLESENSYLKVQINPHFLFNSLGLIHNLVSKHSETAGDTIVLLSDMMRYALNNTHTENQVFLTDEIEHINNYIQINQYRFNHKLHLTFECTGNLNNVKIIPLLLMTIVENIFKYGELHDPQNAAEITISEADERLDINVSNKKGTRKNFSSTGIGMSNIKKRLDLHYNNNYKLIVNDADERYNLNLIINI